ncbi:MAG TPA: TfoX/Sxy family protein [Stellaceae bacterium]|nr:TfoX/Sxy family protein [Stellaceae bacterium]
MAYDERTAERVRNLLSKRRGVVEKKLMGGLCFMVAGGMCCSVSGRGGLLIRIRPNTQEQMLREPHVQPVEMRGRIMTGFVRVAPEGYRTETALTAWVNRGIDAVRARSEKPSRSRPRRSGKPPNTSTESERRAKRTPVSR